MIYTSTELSTEDKEQNVNVQFSSCIKDISSALTDINPDSEEQTFFFFLVEILP